MNSKVFWVLLAIFFCVVEVKSSSHEHRNEVNGNKQHTEHKDKRDHHHGKRESRHHRIKKGGFQSFVPDPETQTIPSLCTVLCADGANYGFSLLKINFTIMFDQTSNTMAFVDLKRNIAMCFTKNLNAMAVVNTATGWSMVMDLETGHCITQSVTIQNAQYLSFGKFDFKMGLSALQAISQTIVTVKPMIPVDKNLIYNMTYAADFNILLKFFESGADYNVFIEDGLEKHLAKNSLYEQIITNIADIADCIMNKYKTQLTVSTMSLWDITWTLLDRHPNCIQNSIISYLDKMVASATGFASGTYSYTNMFSLMSMFSAASQNLITSISLGSDYSWTATTSSNSWFSITYTGKFVVAGAISGGLDNSQDTLLPGNIPVSPVDTITIIYDEYTPPAPTYLWSPVVDLGSSVGNAIGLAGLSKPLAEASNNMGLAAMDLLSGGFLNTNADAEANAGVVSAGTADASASASASSNLLSSWFPTFNSPGTGFFSNPGSSASANAAANVNTSGGGSAGANANSNASVTGGSATANANANASVTGPGSANANAQANASVSG